MSWTEFDLSVAPLYVGESQNAINKENGRGHFSCGVVLLQTSEHLALTLVDHQNNFHTAHIPIVEWLGIVDRVVEARRLAQLATAVADADGAAPRHFETVEWSEGKQTP